MIEKRIFYIIASCVLVLAGLFAKHCFDLKVKSDLLNTEKRIMLTQHYVNEFEFYWVETLDKNTDAFRIVLAHDKMEKIENDMRQDGYNGEEIGSAKSAGYKAAREYLKWLIS